MGVSYREEKNRVFARLSQIERHRCKVAGTLLQPLPGPPRKLSFKAQTRINAAAKANYQVRLM